MIDVHACLPERGMYVVCGKLRAADEINNRCVLPQRTLWGYQLVDENRRCLSIYPAHPTLSYAKGGMFVAPLYTNNTTRTVPYVPFARQLPLLLAADGRALFRTKSLCTYAACRCLLLHIQHMAHVQVASFLYMFSLQTTRVLPTSVIPLARRLVLVIIMRVHLMVSPTDVDILHGGWFPCFLLIFTACCI